MIKINHELLAMLDREYSNALPIYHATRYWQAHIDKIRPELDAIDLSELKNQANIPSSPHLALAVSHIYLHQGALPFAPKHLQSTLSAKPQRN